MLCIQCGSLEDKVIDSRMSKNETITHRCRECLQCNYRYTTYEQIKHPELRVVKRNSTRQTLHREKLLRGLVKVCEKRPVSMDHLDRAVEEILRTSTRTTSLNAPLISSVSKPWTSSPKSTPSPTYAMSQFTANVKMSESSFVRFKSSNTAPTATSPL